MKDIIIYSVNFIAHMAQYKNITALDIFLECLGEFLSEREIDLIIEESALYLKQSDPKLATWFEEQLKAMMLEGQLVNPLNIEDLKHILLDEGFIENLDFTVKDNKIKLSNSIKNFLEENYDFESIGVIFDL